MTIYAILYTTEQHNKPQYNKTCTTIQHNCIVISRIEK